MVTPPSPARSSARLVWPDVAKGACILLVVLHHVILKDYEFLVADTTYGPIADVWHAVTYGLKPVRMPLFFVVSGLFAAGAIHRPWRSSWRRLVSGYYLYLVWLMLFIAIYALDRDIPANRVVSLADLAGELVWAASSLWFLYALVVYLALAKLLRRLPRELVVGAAAGLSVSVSALGIEENNRASVLAHLVYFLVGAFYPHLLRRLARLHVPTPVLVGWGALYIGATGVLTSALPWSAGAFVASLIGIPLGIQLAVRCADTGLGAGLAWVGRRTLRIYVLHLAVLVLVVQLPVTLPTDGTLGLAVAIGYPVVTSTVVVGACLAVHRALVRLGWGSLFALPAALDQRLVAAASGAGAPVATGHPVPAAGAKVPSDAGSGGVG